VPVHARIVATGGYVPGEPITNADVEELVGPVAPDLLESMHMEQRHWVVDRHTGEHRETTSQLATKAMAQALDRAGLPAGELDLLIVSTASPDYQLPPTVTLVQEQLGIERCAVLELRSGGAGVVQGLDIARLYLEAGIYRTAGVIGCDAISPLQAQIFLGDRKRMRVRDRLLVYMFGDGAGAVLLEAGAEPGVIGSAIGCIGTGRPSGMEIRGGGGTYAPYSEQREGRVLDLYIDIEQASSFTATLTTTGLQDVLERTGVSPESVDVLVTPEADTEWMANAAAAGGADAEIWSAFEHKIFNALPIVGAPGSAALPLGLDRAWTTGLLQPGRRALLLGMETTKWIYAGMVVDWTAATPAS
jgi:3-oxoacyl-[acyl-carrier-protein] synthase-3